MKPVAIDRANSRKSTPKQNHRVWPTDAPRAPVLHLQPTNAPLMTRNEVAALLRTTPRQISNMTARGQLPAAVRVAGLGARWRRSEIDAWIAAQ